MIMRKVESKQNARLKELRRAFAKPGRDTHGLAGIEGANLLEEALRGQLHVPCVFVAEGAEDRLEGLRLPPATAASRNGPPAAAIGATRRTKLT